MNVTDQGTEERSRVIIISKRGLSALWTKCESLRMQPDMDISLGVHEG